MGAGDGGRLRFGRDMVRGLERATCVEHLQNVDAHTWTEIWHTSRGAVFIVTDFTTGERTVYMHDGYDDDAKADLQAVVNHN